MKNVKTIAIRIAELAIAGLALWKGVDLVKPVVKKVLGLFKKNTSNK